ncbi:hypothetical protein BDZ91DRAFT_695832 [Kalaharituber pfeilii]|nr:hypothetical protein BDZ91DRAFT_695832 [Kalaharituber pfeilii]
MSARLLPQTARLTTCVTSRSSRVISRPSVCATVHLSRIMSSSSASNPGRTTGQGTGDWPLDPKDASQVRGHVTWIKGMAEEMVGRISGAQSWTESGQQDKARGIHEMRLAKEEGDRRAEYDKRSPIILNVEGTSEKVAGYMTGCAGMKERGSEKQNAAKSKTT